MVFYHFENGKLVRVNPQLQKLADTVQYAGHSFFEKAGWDNVEDIDMVYTVFAPGAEAVPNDHLAEYAYAFLIDDVWLSSPWVIMVRDDPDEYLDVMRKVEPLFTRASFMS